MQFDNNKILVSIVIPVYNTEQYLDAAISSAVHQSYRKLEIIVVDDGSPDNSYLIAERYTVKDKRVHLVRQSNMGLSGARNTGISRCKGEYILFLDSDDILVNDAIEQLLKVALTDKADVVVSDRYIKIFEDTGTRSICYHFINTHNYRTPVKFALDVMINKGRAWRASGVLYKASIIREHNISFPLGYTSEDIVFNLLFLTHAYKISTYNNIIIECLQRIGSITKSFNPRLVETFLFIDNKVEEFLINNNCHNEHGLNLRDSLLCRNTIVLVTSFMSNRNIETFRNKIKQVKVILCTQRYKESFYSNKVFEPYFDSSLTMMYFKTMYYLIKFKIYLPAFILAWFVGIISTKTHKTF